MKISLENRRAKETDYAFGYNDTHVSMVFRDDYYENHANITMTPVEARELAKTLKVFADICEFGMDATVNGAQTNG